MDFNYKPSDWMDSCEMEQERRRAWILGLGGNLRLLPLVTTQGTQSEFYVKFRCTSRNHAGLRHLLYCVECYSLV